MGRKDASPREARLASHRHVDHHVWLTNDRYDALKPAVRAVARGTWLFIRGTMTRRAVRLGRELALRQLVGLEEVVNRGDGV